jgi:hypothetical protein
MNELEQIVQRMIDAGEPEAAIAAVIQEYNQSVGSGKTDAAAEETATVVADQPSELGLQSGNGLSEQRYSHPDEDRGFFDALIFEPLSKGG